MTRRLVIALSLFGFASALYAQQPKVLAPHKPVPPRVEKPVKWLTPPMQRSMVGGLWMTDTDFKSSIYLKNGVETDSVTVTPILHLSNGAKYILPDVTVKPAGLAIISINDELQKKGISSWATLSGYVELQYTWPWDPFCATVRNIDTAHSLIFTYSLRPTLPLPLHLLKPIFAPPTHTVEGMWWKHEKNVTGFVAIANLASHPADTSVQITDSHGLPISQHRVSVSPHGMKFIKLPELQTTAAVQGGVRITSSELSDNLVINGGLEDQTIGYSAGMPFAAEAVDASASPEHQTVAELGVMAGAADPMMLFPAGTTFTPYSVLRNVSDAPLSVSPTLWWMEGGIPHSAPLPQIILQPFQTQSLETTSLLSVFGPKNFNGSFNIAFETMARRGSLVMSSGSVDQTGTYVFEVGPRGVGESASKSLQQWTTANGDDTMVTVWNPADEAQDFLFTLFFEGGHYSLPLHMQPRETRTFNVSEVIQNQVPDAEGNLIPSTVHQGTAKIAGSQAENQHILVAVDAGIYNVRKATCSQSCQECDGYNSFYVINNPFGVAVSFTHQESAMAQYHSGTTYNMTSGSSWGSSKTTVATVGTGLVTGKAAGSVTITATFSNEPADAGYICTGGNPCPETTFTNSGGGGVFSISSVSPSSFIYGGSGVLSITGSGFSAFSTSTLSINFDDSSITATGSVTQGSDTQITGTYQVQCGATVGPHNIWITFTGGDGGSGTPSNQLPITVSLPAAPMPTIKLGGNTISGTQSVVVGQQIALTGSVSLPACMSISGQQWTPSSSSTAGTPIGGYSASTSSGSVSALPPNTNSTYTFYWVYPTNGVTATYQYTMSGGGGSAPSPVATATFNVTGPSGGTMTTTHYSNVTIANLGSCVRNGKTIPAGPWIVYGNVTGTCSSLSGTPGMTFNSPTGYSNSSGGSFQTVQLINSDTLSGSYNYSFSTGLDASYPYGNSFPDTDAPKTQLLSTYTTLTQSFNATIFLMWKSSTALAIPVPLGYQTWAFSGTATCSSSCNSASNWKSATNGTPGPVGSFTASNASQTSVGNNELQYGVPIWTGLSQ